MSKGRRTREQIRAKELHLYTDSHGGPDLCDRGDKLTCLACAHEVQRSDEKCPGCGRKIDWKKEIVVFGRVPRRTPAKFTLD